MNIKNMFFMQISYPSTILIYTNRPLKCLRHAVFNAYKYRVNFCHMFPTLPCNSLFISGVQLCLLLLVRGRLAVSKLQITLVIWDYYHAGHSIAVFNKRCLLTIARDNSTLVLSCSFKVGVYISDYRPR